MSASLIDYIIDLQHERDDAWQALRRHRIMSPRGHFNDGQNPRGDAECQRISAKYIDVCTQLEDAWQALSQDSGLAP